MKMKSSVFITFLVLCGILLIVFVPSHKDSNKAKHVSKMRVTSSNAKLSNETGGSQELKNAIDTLINEESALDGSIIGINIRSFDTGDVLYDHFGDVRMNPASNMKLLTAASALSVLGADYTFTTEILTDGNIKKKMLNGDLYIKGKGDPTLLLDDFLSFADDLKEQGITAISGDVVGDDTWYDDIRLSPGIVWDDEDYYYGAQISALNAAPDDDYDAGSVMLEVSPSSPGEKPRVEVLPENDYVTVKNKANTVDATGEHDIEVERKHGTNTITVKGTIPVNSWNAKEWMAVWEPTDYALHLFEQALEEKGIDIKGDVKRSETPDDADVLLSHDSMALKDLLIPFMKLSNNTHAEVLVKEMGKVVHDEGSWEKGLEVMNDVLPDFAVDVDRLVIQDGSGISHDDLLPAREITKLLYHIQTEDWFDDYVTSLPVTGETDRMISGTLQERMDDMSVQAKTGTINGVSSLSGYTETNSGEKLIFSILINSLLDDEDGPPVEDKIIKAIVNDDGSD